MSANDYYNGGQPKGQYYPPQGPPPGQGGYYPQQPQQSYQGYPQQGYPQQGYQPQPPRPSTFSSHSKVKAVEADAWLV
ncbi:hypothetical protein CYLTODRAFT_451403 [Cylindrobasidium torrendii FP15055 ss-10]|uniref:Uncharacterized protein n=1 Tax=Cylindrobasidium torrendii FP15055 ss-10 TaxID=1314674 RepID=A0A0D7BJR9_9AGAR|nr:hypothetical protein CYLTODRAFT_451403 [Cylindrobasidium torrendii FP15055 ss-10]